GATVGRDSRTRLPDVGLSTDRGCAALCAMTDLPEPGVVGHAGDAHQVWPLYALFDVLLCLGINRASRTVRTSPIPPIPSLSRSVRKSHSHADRSIMRRLKYTRES